MELSIGQELMHMLAGTKVLARKSVKITHHVPRQTAYNEWYSAPAILFDDEF